MLSEKIFTKVKSVVGRLTGRAGSAKAGHLFINKFSRNDFHFDPNLSQEEKKALFKKNVQMVELEPNSYCNRTCSFCPNSFIDRIKEKTYLDHGIYDSIIRDLAAINYDGTLRFARYSEPLAFHENLCNLITKAREQLPNCTIDIVSNGDYAKPQVLEALKKAGLSVMRISIYPDTKDKTWTKESAKAKMLTLGKRIGLPAEKITEYGDSVSCVYPFDGFRIEAWSHNFDVKGFDRGQSMPDLIEKDFVRKSPCSMVFTNFTVEFDGTVMPCCNLRSDYEDHKKYKIGNLSEPGSTSIFDVYANKNYNAWRRSLVRVSGKADPCRTCKQKASFDESKLASVAPKIDKKLASLGVLDEVKREESSLALH